MFSNQKVSLHENKPDNSNTVSVTHEKVTTMVVKDVDRTTEIGIVVMITDLIRDETSRLEMQVEAFHPETGVKLLHGVIDCLISSGKK